MKIKRTNLLSLVIEKKVKYQLQILFDRVNKKVSVGTAGNKKKIITIFSLF